MEKHVSHLQSLVADPSLSIIFPLVDGGSSSRYVDSTKTWSVSQDRHPQVVLEPQSEEELQRIVGYLAGETDFDFAIRGTGVGNSSASDVVVSMAAFRQIQWDDDGGTIEVGAGLTLGDVDRWLDEHQPDYAVVGSRCPFVGVAGSTLTGGLSWVSSTLGLGSDPANLLDVRIVLPSGREPAFWASAWPDAQLLWALRGGGGNFGAVTRLRLQAHRCSRRNWSGMIRYGNSRAALPVISRRLARFAARDRADGLACHVFIVDWGIQALHGGRPEPDLVILPFDPLGEEHARSDDGFRWALEDVSGGADAGMCAELPLSAVHAAQAAQTRSHGALQSWMSAPLIDSSPATLGDTGDGGGHEQVTAIDEHTVERAWEWYTGLAASDDANTRKFSAGAFALVEVMQAPTMTASGSAAATAWPHFALGRKNVLQLGIGCAPAASPAEAAADHALAMQILRDAPVQIAGGGGSSGGSGSGSSSNQSHHHRRQHQPPASYLPNFILPDMNDVPAIFGDNWQQLRQVKTRYDPQGRFNKGFFVPPL